ncbi:prolyl-tRNA synthetase [Candidatus Termititenax spirochaetophilus]|uniref:Proline--tRNA ligase n=1 Tax=Candidatus Termititenax spirochaetophilus TaxID=2218522 RepID=A0A388T779_9BACT|nr:prolyl-tRNA synthetase [Candidatus Termititenax spirochaetophilus]
MRISKLLMPTLREDPADAEIISHKLMIRAGLIQKAAVGIYNYLPFGYRVIRKVENIIREEMNRAGAQELLMPMVVPAELWQSSGRWDKYGKELLRLKDRKESDYCLGPTHEEVITYIAKSFIHSYKQLPINLYQIQGKFRDEIRPRFGLMRGREFIMKDAYSFHASQESLDSEYQNMHDTYCRIFERCGLKYKVVDADSGNIGGSVSQEFMVLAENGEDALLSCTKCSYSANVEAAKAQTTVGEQTPTEEPVKETATPGKRTIEEVSSFLQIAPDQLIKTLVYYYKANAKEDHVIVLLRGDHQINEVKLKNYLDADVVLLAEDTVVRKITGVEPGFCGPVGLKNVRIIADNGVQGIADGVTGANKKDTHLINVVPGRDFPLFETADLRLAAAGDKCPHCGAPLEAIRGIEVGHIFKLGTKYSQAMQAEYLDQSGASKPFIMGCYGIGVGRTAAAAIEQNFDASGIVWPKALAPYHCVVIPANIKEPAQLEAAEKIYQELLTAGVEVLLDDREERIGVKLKDMELIGITSRIVVGKALAEGKVEFRLRSAAGNELLPVAAAVRRVIQEFKE